MREISIGDKIVRVKASALALLFYKQEFGADLVGDMVKMQGIEKDIARFDSVVLMQMTWAMAKADAYGKQFPGFERWVADLESFDMSDPELLLNIMGEAMDGFFRGGNKQK